MNFSLPGELRSLVDATIDQNASDLHVSGASAPAIRRLGKLEKLSQSPMSSDSIRSFIQSASSDLLGRLDSRGDADFSFTYRESRFRVNAYREQGELALAIRLLTEKIPSMDDLRLPPVVQKWPQRGTGLVIVTGPTGSGKSTSVASMVNEINQNLDRHILTIEDPIEYLINPAVSTVRQREIGQDAADFASAVRAGLREDLDVMVIGEMRDLETISAAITVAETGHLVFATLHTSSASMAVDRIIDAFEPGEQALIRSRLAACLLGVVYQRLLPSEKLGRVAAYEVLVANLAIRNLIRESKTHQMPNVLATSRSEGMQLIGDSVKELVAAGLVSSESADDFIKSNHSYR